MRPSIDWLSMPSMASYEYVRATATALVRMNFGVHDDGAQIDEWLEPIAGASGNMRVDVEQTCLNSGKFITMQMRCVRRTNLAVVLYNIYLYI